MRVETRAMAMNRLTKTLDMAISFSDFNISDMVELSVATVKDIRELLDTYLQEEQNGHTK